MWLAPFFLLVVGFPVFEVAGEKISCLFKILNCEDLCKQKTFHPWFDFTTVQIKNNNGGQNDGC